jgi:SSS family solute:Na+ symporter
MVQRYLAARSQRQAALALIASGFVVLMQFALFLLIGVSLWVFYRTFPPTPPLGRSDEAFTYFIVNYLPTGVLGLVIAATFSAAMGTLAGSLNSSASAIVNDLYRPLASHKDERHLIRVGRAMTIVWGILLTLVALGARHLQATVVSNALTIASFVFGILLGLFLLGILTKRVGQTASLIGVIAGLSAVSYAKFGTELAWPWFASVGSLTVFIVGLSASFIIPGEFAPRPEKSLR